MLDRLDFTTSRARPLASDPELRFQTILIRSIFGTPPAVTEDAAGGAGQLFGVEHHRPRFNVRSVARVGVRLALCIAQL